MKHKDIKNKEDPLRVIFQRMQKESELRKKKLAAMPMDKFKAHVKRTIVLHREAEIQVRVLGDLLNDMHECCPHDEGIILPHLDGAGYARPRNVYCSICHDVVSRYCKKNKTHICEYNTPDKKAQGHHDACIHCGKWWEDG